MDQYMLLQNIWLILLLWGIVYLADYYFTIFNAKKYKNNIDNYIQQEGSYEITPIFQDDIDNLRLFSPRFLKRWLISLFFIYGIWWLSFNVINWPQYFHFFIGALLLREFAVHLRHLRNFAGTYFLKEGGITGKIEYKRWYLLKLSAAEMFFFGFLYLLFGIFYGSWFFFGGVFGCWVVAVKHWRYAKKSIKSGNSSSQDESA